MTIQQVYQSLSASVQLFFLILEFHNNLDTFSGLVVGLKVLLLWVRFVILVDGSGVSVFNCFLRKRFVTMIVLLHNFTFTSSGIQKKDFGFCFSLYFCFSCHSSVLLQFSQCLFLFCLSPSMSNVSPCFVNLISVIFDINFHFLFLLFLLLQ